MNAAAHAALLAEYCLEVKEGRQVLVRGSTLAAPLLIELQRAVLARGAWPVLRPELPGQAEAFHAALREDVHLDALAPGARAEAEATDAFLSIQSPENTSALAGVDPARLARIARAAEPLQRIRMQRRWCVTIWPTPALAQQAGMGTVPYAAFLARALFLDRPDPVAAWRELGAFQAELAARLGAASEIRIEGEGTDLTLAVGGRTWINSDGRRNMPSGEVFTGPREDSAEGRIRFALASAPGVDVGEVSLTFRAGLVVEASAAGDQAYLDAALATDAGARRLGELGVGTNFGIDRATGSILLDEKIGGTVHLALGRSYPETGGVNESAAHWDLVCDLRAGGRLSADGATVLEDGRFV